MNPHAIIPIELASLHVLDVAVMHRCVQRSALPIARVAVVAFLDASLEPCITPLLAMLHRTPPPAHAGKPVQFPHS